MEVIKTEKHLLLKLEDEKTIYDIITSDDLMWNDICFYSSNWDGWNYFYDADKNQVICINDYGYNILHDLLKNGYCYAEYKENGEDYQDYEWNENYE